MGAIGGHCSVDALHFSSVCALWSLSLGRQDVMVWYIWYWKGAAVMDAALGSMVGLIPLTVGAGVVMKVSEASFGTGGTASRVQRKARRQTKPVRQGGRRLGRRSIQGIGNFDNVLP